MTVPTPRFCSACGGPLAERRLGAEQRLVCDGCGAVSYRNPKVLVTTILAHAGRVLLCRRAEPPAVGRWALPGGFMECNETLEEAGARETREETGIRVDPQDLLLHALSTLPDISEVYVGLRVELREEPVVAIGPECLDARFFAESEVPWAELAYTDIAAYLRVFFEEQRSNQYSVHFSRLQSTEVVGRNYHIAQIDEIRRLRTVDNPEPPKL